MAKFGTHLAKKRQNLAKFFYLKTPEERFCWPFLALILGKFSQAPKILTDFGCLERAHQLFRPEKANWPFFGVFSVKRMTLYHLCPTDAKSALATALSETDAIGPGYDQGHATYLTQIFLNFSEVAMDNKAPVSLYTQAVHIFPTRCHGKSGHFWTSIY